MDYAAALAGRNQELGELLRDADWSVPVPTCPGWTLLQLLRPVGRRSVFPRRVRPGCIFLRRHRRILPA
jgi:Mycothiol maleylpyruvate isomerase N-terminal domain